MDPFFQKMISISSSSTISIFSKENHYLTKALKDYSSLLEFLLYHAGDNLLTS